MQSMKKVLASLAAGLLLSGSAMASGYQVVLQGSRVTGLGNCGVGYVAGAASLWFNPGAMGMVEKSSIMLGANGVNSKIKYLSPSPSTYTAESESPLGTPFFAYGVYKINDKLVAGLGVVTPYGSTVKWNPDWEGQFVLRDLSLSSFYIQPTVSYKINDQLSIGAGVDFAIGSVELNRGVPLANQSGNYGNANLKGSSKLGVGFNVGVYYEPTEQLSVGLSYRSRINAVVEEGDVTFDVPSLAAGNFQATKFSAELPLPSVASLGVAFYPLAEKEKMMVTAEAALTSWSAYEELRFEYNAPVAGSTSTVSKRNYKDSFVFKLGVEYQPIENLKLRAGGYFDQAAAPDGYMTPETPDTNTLGLTLGVGYTIAEKFTVDVHYLNVNRQKRKNVAAPDANTLSGTFHPGAHVFGMGLSYSF